MLGRDLVSVLSATPAADLALLDIDNCDITQTGAVLRFFEEARPETVLHAAAYTDVDGCERDPELAMRVNGEGTRNVARAARALGARLIYISTDYVFDGEKSAPYDECDAPNPRSAYGRSKLAGEQAVKEMAGGAIVRTAWLYGQYGRHFVKAILEQARQGKPLRVVSDQLGSPTWSLDLARTLATLAVTPGAGIFHATGSGHCSWFEFARTIVEEAAEIGAISPVPVEPVSARELARPAPRPASSVLGNRRLRELGIAPLPHWRDSLRAFLRVILTEWRT